MRAKLLEQRLEGRDFLVAGRMTLADISVGYPLNTMGKPHFASLLGPRTTAYRERLLARPAFQRAAAVPSPGLGREFISGLDPGLSRGVRFRC